MSLFIDKKYIMLLGDKLRLFTQRGEFLWNFKCPVCGDSKKDPLKARGFIYRRKEHFGFMCHNCSASMSLPKFIKFVDPFLYQEYQLEKFMDSKPKKETIDLNIFDDTPEFKSEAIDEQTFSKLDYVTSIADMNVKSEARKYLEERKVPIDRFFYTDDFSDFVKKTFPNENKKIYNEPRIIIPFFHKDGYLLGVQGRAIGPSKVKYITIKADETYPKIFNWNRLDDRKNVYVCEGPIDSLFLFNSVATMDAALYNAANIIGLDLDYIFVYDNEPRNNQIVSNMRKTIALGRKICIWPDNIEQKDINEMVLAGMHPSEIQHIIDHNSYEGMMATLKMNQWAKL